MGGGCSEASGRVGVSLIVTLPTETQLVFNSEYSRQPCRNTAVNQLPSNHLRYIISYDVVIT